MKVFTLVGTRPELIKMALVIRELDKHTNHILVHSGQNYDYELNEVFFEDLGIRKPDYFLDSAGSTACETIGNLLVSVEKLLDQERPDAFVIYGDTNSCLAVITAKKKKIPIFHMEAGNRCFDQRVPEEVNRKIVDHLSDINMVHSEHARRYLLDEGISPDTIFKMGSPMGEIFNYYSDKISNSNILDKLNLEAKDYFVLSSHREENIDNPENFESLLGSLEALSEEYGKKIIFSTHPRTKKKLEQMDFNFEGSSIVFMKPLGFFDYIKLQKEAFCVLSDSGTLTEESSFLKFPGVMIRQAHERPEGMDVASVLMSDLKTKSILDSVKISTEAYFNSPEIVDYSDNEFSKKVLRIIFSYKDFINRTVWKKDK